jgi:hypothetical protein
MRRRLLAVVTFLCLAALPTSAWPAPAPAPDGKRPGLVIRIQAIDELLANFKYLAAQAGQEEQAKQLEGLVKSMAGPKGLDGIDTKKPIALYGTVGPNGIDSTAVLLIPVADEQGVLDLLARFDIKAEKGKDGLYTVRNDQLPVPVFFRFANKHAYITVQDDSAIARDRLLAPEKVNPPGATGVVSLSVNIGDIPDNLKQQAIQEFQQQLANAKQMREPDETETQHKFKGQLIDFLGGHVVSFIRDGDDVTLAINIDRKTHDISLDLSVTGKARSKLAGTIAELNQAKSVVAGLVGKNTTFNSVMYAALPEDLRKALAPVIDEAIKKGLEEEKDKAKRDLAARLTKVIEPTLKVAELDLAVDVRGPSARELYTVVAGARLKDGAAIEKVLRDTIKDLPPADRAKVKLDADKAGAVSIHRIEIQKDLDEDARKSFGDNPLYVAFRADAVFVTVGENGLAAIKEALAASPKPAVPFKFELSLASMAPAMAATQPDAVKAAREAFGKGGENDKVWLSIEGGQSLRLRMAMKAPIIKFISKLAPIPGAGQ